MTNCKSVTTPLSPARSTFKETCAEPVVCINRNREAIGALLYISNGTRNDVAAAVGILARKFEIPNQAD